MNQTLKKNNSNKWVLYLPLILVELYLNFSIWLYACGPINYGNPNVSKVVGYLLILHVALAGGYILGIYYLQHSGEHLCKALSFPLQGLIDVWKKYYWLFWIICIVAVYFKVNTYIDVRTPIDFVKAVYNGMVNPTAQYMSKYFSIQQAENRIFILFCMAIDGLLSPITYTFLPIALYLKKELGSLQKCSLYVLCLTHIMVGVITGSNGVNFVLTVLLFVAFVTSVAKDFDQYKWKAIGKHISIFGMVILIVSISVLFFVYTLNLRTGGDMTGVIERRTEASSEASRPNSAGNNSGDHSNSEGKDTKLLQAIELVANKLNSFYTSFSFYLTNSIHGLALAMEEPFVWTYGVGHSSVLYQTIETVLSVSIDERTYFVRLLQSDKIIDTGVATPADYAGDVTFAGTIVVLFFIGIGLSILWICTVYYDNMLTLAMMPVCGLFFITFYGRNVVLHQPYYYFAFTFTLLILLFGAGYHFYRKNSI